MFSKTKKSGIKWNIQGEKHFPCIGDFSLT